MLKSSKAGRDTARAAGAARRSARRLARDRRGNAAMLVGLALMPMLAATGLGLDSLLAFMVRDRLQSATDAAALAAGKVMRSGSPEADARRFLEANFPPGYLRSSLGDPEVAVDPGGTRLTVETSAAVPTYFMRFFGDDATTVRAKSVVQRDIKKTELVLVLDNTGSMLTNDAIGALKRASLELVDIVYGSEPGNPGRKRTRRPDLWVGVVPFVASVNIGPSRTGWLAPGDRARTRGAFAPTTWKGCVMARPNGEDQTETTPGTAPFTSYFYAADVDNRWGATVDEKLESYNNGTGPNLGCGSPVTPLVAERETVEAALEAMGPWHRGGTLGSEGLAWGWRVISPEWRELWGEVQGQTPRSPAGHPADYDDADIEKVVVLMTDGENQLFDWTYHEPAGGVGPRGSDFSAVGRLEDFGFASLGAGKAEIDRRMANICDGMKAKGIKLYTITFGSVPGESTKRLYERCATAPDMYFHAPDNAKLVRTFQMVGERLTQLRVVR